MKHLEKDNKSNDRIETSFNISLISNLSMKEKQNQQTYRPIIGVHKWFARRPGSLFRGLLLSEFSNQELSQSYYKPHNFSEKIILDPFMGGGTPIFESLRIGMNVIGCDTNPMSWWIVNQEVGNLDRKSFLLAAEEVIDDVSKEIGQYYKTRCTKCSNDNAEVKYFLWVKQEECNSCHKENDLFPGYLIAKNTRHIYNTYYCPHCSNLIEFNEIVKETVPCPKCGSNFSPEGNAKRNSFKCSCGSIGKYPSGSRVPKHRMFAIEYYCPDCSPNTKGRLFKVPDNQDFEHFRSCESRLEQVINLIPTESVPKGDETNRLLRWGYKSFSDLFNKRQLLSLGLLLDRIRRISDKQVRNALATVFSDTLRYQNMLVRYDTYSLKCQDIFSLHGFPVGLIQCENNMLGIPKIGSGGFNHFVRKMDKAKEYCEEPFEIFFNTNGQKRKLPIKDEHIIAKLVTKVPDSKQTRQAYLSNCSVEQVDLKPNSIDGVFTDPPYFDNVQYAELMDFCFIWLRKIISREVKEFEVESTRSKSELTVNQTENRDLTYFTSGISKVYCHCVKALKKGAPFVFTYHHNNLEAYIPIAVAILDSGLICTETLPCPAEMGASLHINGTSSSIIDSVFICRRPEDILYEPPADNPQKLITTLLSRDIEQLKSASIPLKQGDLYCMSLGHFTKIAIDTLYRNWNVTIPIVERIKLVRCLLTNLKKEYDISFFGKEVLT